CCFINFANAKTAALNCALTTNSMPLSDILSCNNNLSSFYRFLLCAWIAWLLFPLSGHIFFEHCQNFINWPGSLAQLNFDFETSGLFGLCFNPIFQFTCDRCVDFITKSNTLLV